MRGKVERREVDRDGRREERLDCTMHEISSSPSGVPSRPHRQLLGRGVLEVEVLQDGWIAGWFGKLRRDEEGG